MMNMVETKSKMNALGTKAPDFTLLEPLSGANKSLSQVQGQKGMVVMFICNHCPFVKHVQAGLVALANDYQNKGIGFVAINANDASKYPDDSPENMKNTATRFGYSFPYLYDETQQVAKAYDAVCTPDFFIYDANLALVYRGQLDDSRPGNAIPVTGNDLRAALDCILTGQPVSSNQKPSVGCNIKWA
jgi:peroxiredoxin